MKIAVTGADGQLGSFLCRELESQNLDVIPLVYPAFDLTSHPGDSVRRTRPDVLIHGAAMTNVDGCTEDPALALKCNGLGTADLAAACEEIGARMIYVSSNEVFPGDQHCTYYEYDATRSMNAYGRSKLAGERLAAAACSRLSITRLSWVFGPGFVNFPRKMIELSEKHPKLRIVADEVANATYAPDAAAAIVSLLEHDVNGIFHLCNAGAVSRFDFARAIFDRTGRESYPLEPIALSDFSRPSRPPLHSPMGNELAASLGIVLRPWQDALQDWVSLEN